MRQEANVAFRVIGMLASAADTGQPVLASSANLRNSSSVSPGTFATTVSSLPVIPTPGWKPTTA